MSTIKSSAENLTLNADGANNDIIFQSNGSNVATLDQAGTLTATTFTGAATDATKLPLAGGTLTGNTTIATNSTPKLILKRTGNNAGNGYIECHGADDSVDYKIAFAQSSGVMSFDVGGTRMLGVTSDGLCFNSDTAAANALDDYEEGTFTPTMDIENGSVTLSASYGYYVKIGRFVSARMDMQVSAISGAGGSNAWEWGGLPFAVNASNSGYTPISGIRATNMSSAPESLTGFAITGSSGGRIEEQGNSTSNSSNLLSSTTRVQMTFIYEV